MPPLRVGHQGRIAEIEIPNVKGMSKFKLNEILAFELWHLTFRLSKFQGLWLKGHPFHSIYSLDLFETLDHLL